VARLLMEHPRDTDIARLAREWSQRGGALEAMADLAHRMSNLEDAWRELLEGIADTTGIVPNTGKRLTRNPGAGTVEEPGGDGVERGAGPAQVEHKGGDADAEGAC
jgi:hypothetical protein